MNITLSSLHYFIVTAKLEHVSAAADQLHITQPSLTAAIHRLEADIGFRLFDREGRGVRLNQYGKIFLDGAVKADRAIEESLREMEKLRSSTIRYTRISCSSSQVNTMSIGQMLTEGLHLQVHEIPENWSEELSSGRTDLVVTMDDIEQSGISHLLLHSRRLVIVVSKNHPLASRKKVTLNELRNYSFCSTDSTHSLIHLIERSGICPAFQPHIAFLGRNSEDMVRAIDSGIYVGVMVKINLPDRKDLIALPVEGFDVLLPIYLYWRTSESNTCLISRAKQIFAENYSRLPAD